MYDVHERYDADVHRWLDHCIGRRTLQIASEGSPKGYFNHWLQPKTIELWSAGCYHVRVDVDFEYSCRRHDVPNYAGRA